jgi:general secretion pathway protein L
VQHRLDEVIGFELERETPFSDEDIYWNYLVAEKGSSIISVLLVVVPRRRVASILSRAQTAGVKPQGLFVEVQPDLGIVIELEPQSHWRKIQADRSRVLLSSAAVALAALAVVLPFALQSLEFAKDAALEAKLNAQAAEAGALRHSLDTLREASEFLERKQATSIDPLEVLANATDVIPDDSYITEFLLHGSRLSLTGASPASAKLIPVLLASGRFKDPAFDGPVLQSDSGALETFTITATALQGKPS